MRDKIVVFVRVLRSLFAGGSIVFLFGCLIVLLILFIVKPGLRDSTEKAMAFYASLVPSAIGAIIGTYLLRSFKRTLGSAGSLSGAVSSWLAREPLLLAFLWVVAIIELTALSYLVPAYALRLELRVDDSGSVAARVASVVALPAGIRLEQVADSGYAAWYESGRTFRWGDSVQLEVRRLDGQPNDTTSVQWSAFDLLRIFSAIEAPTIKIHVARATITVRPTPNSATVQLHANDVDTTAHGPITITVPLGTTVRVTVSASDFESYNRLIDVSADITITPSLVRLPGQLRIRAVNPGGQTVGGLEVFVDGTSRGVGTARAIELAPGLHTIFLEKRFRDRIVFARAFEVDVEGGVTVECEVETTVRLPHEPLPNGLVAANCTSVR